MNSIWQGGGFFVLWDVPVGVLRKFVTTLFTALRGDLIRWFYTSSWWLNGNTHSTTVAIPLSHDSPTISGSSLPNGFLLVCAFYLPSTMATCVVLHFDCPFSFPSARHRATQKCTSSSVSVRRSVSWWPAGEREPERIFLRLAFLSCRVVGRFRYIQSPSSNDARGESFACCISCGVALRLDFYAVCLPFEDQMEKVIHHSWSLDSLPLAVTLEVDPLRSVSISLAVGFASQSFLSWANEVSHAQCSLIYGPQISRFVIVLTWPIPFTLFSAVASNNVASRPNVEIQRVVKTCSCHKISNRMTSKHPTLAIRKCSEFHTLFQDHLNIFFATDPPGTPPIAEYFSEVISRCIST